MGLSRRQWLTHTAGFLVGNSLLGLSAKMHIDEARMRSITKRLKLPEYNPTEGLLEQYDEEYWTLVFESKWDRSKKQFKSKLSPEEFEILEKYAMQFVNIDRTRRTKRQNETLYYYNATMMITLKDIMKKEIERAIKRTGLDERYLVEFIRNRSQSLNGNTVYLYNINEDFAKNLYELCQKYDVSPKIACAIAIKENRFGDNKTSSSKALGPMQVKAIMIRDVEEEFNMLPRYEQLSDNDKPWRLIQVGVLAIKLIAKRLDLKHTGFNSEIDIEEYAWVMLCYNQGIEKILSCRDGNFPNETKKYLAVTLSALKYNFEYLRA